MIVLNIIGLVLIPVLWVMGFFLFVYLPFRERQEVPDISEEEFLKDDQPLTKHGEN